jgi:hypothetical protein
MVDARKNIRARQAQERILAALTAKPWMTAAEIVAATDSTWDTPNSVAAILSVLYWDGSVGRRNQPHSKNQRLSVYLYGLARNADPEDLSPAGRRKQTDRVLE